MKLVPVFVIIVPVSPPITRTFPYSDRTYECSRFLCQFPWVTPEIRSEATDEFFRGSVGRLLADDGLELTASMWSERQERFDEVAVSEEPS